MLYTDAHKWLDGIRNIIEFHEIFIITVSDAAFTARISLNTWGTLIKTHLRFLEVSLNFISLPSNCEFYSIKT